jgi:hypothetical protein
MDISEGVAVLIPHEDKFNPIQYIGQIYCPEGVADLIPYED